MLQSFFARRFNAVPTLYRGIKLFSDPGKFTIFRQVGNVATITAGWPQYFESYSSIDNLSLKKPQIRAPLSDTEDEANV